MSNLADDTRGRAHPGGAARRCVPRVALWLLLAAAVFGFGACDSNDALGPSRYWKFINDSSYTVNVGPNEGQTWGAFALAPGGRQEVDPDASEIHYTFSPANHVFVADTKAIDLGLGTEIHFRNL